MYPQPVAPRSMAWIWALFLAALLLVFLLCCFSFEPWAAVLVAVLVVPRWESRMMFNGGFSV